MEKPALKLKNVNERKELDQNVCQLMKSFSRINANSYILCSTIVVTAITFLFNVAMS